MNEVTKAEHRGFQFTLRTLLLFVLVASVLCAVPGTVPKVIDRHLLKERIASIKAGETDTLLNVDPVFVDLVMSDSECVEKTRGLMFYDLEFASEYPDVSDPRLAPLAQLPNLDYAVFSNTVGTDTFLMQLQQNPSLTRLHLSTTYLKGEAVGALSSNDIGHIARIRQLKTLELHGAVSRRTDLRPLANHPSLETLLLQYHHDPKHLSEPIPSHHLEVLRSIPKLRCLRVVNCEITDEAIESFVLMSGLMELDIRVKSVQQMERLRIGLPHAKISPGRRLQDELDSSASEPRIVCRAGRRCDISVPRDTTQL